MTTANEEEHSCPKEDPECEEETPCFYCKVRSISFTYGGGRSDFHGD